MRARRTRSISQLSARTWFDRRLHAAHTKLERVAIRDRFRRTRAAARKPATACQASVKRKLNDGRSVPLAPRRRGPATMTSSAWN